MSLITTRSLLRLWQDAQVHPEWATTGLWEHIFNRIVFSDEPWLVSSQQPPTHAPGDLRRVDLVVGWLDSASNIRMTLLFVEAKRASAGPQDIVEVEMQAYTAACAYAVDRESKDPIWTMTCVGSLVRLWIFDWTQGFLIPYFPNTHGVAERSEYIEISERGTELLKHLEFIKKHPKPPKRLIGEASPRPTDATLPQDWHSEEVVLRDAQYQDTGHGSTSVEWPIAGSTEGDMVDDSHGVQGYGAGLSEAWYDPTTSAAGGCEADMPDAGQHGVDLSVGWNEAQPTSALSRALFDETPLPAEELASTQGAYNEVEELAAPQSVQLWSKVDVRRQPHVTRRDEYIFTTDGGGKRSTDKDHWKKTQYKKKTAWYYRDGNVFYYTREKPGA